MLICYAIGFAICVVYLEYFEQKGTIKKQPLTVPETNETTIVVAPIEVIETENLPSDEPWQSVDVQNTVSVPDEIQESENAPTFDEALEMEVVEVGSPQSKLRRRVSSRLSMKSDELPDYENYECHPVYSL